MGINYLNFFNIPKFLQPTGTIQRNDATRVASPKEHSLPIKRIFPYTTPILSSDIPKSESEKRKSDLKLELYGNIEKELKDLQQGLETISAGLDYTSPSYWINKNGGHLSVAESLGLDFMIYIALGGLAGLAKKGLVQLTKSGIKASPDLLLQLPKNLTKESLEKYGALRPMPGGQPSTPLPATYRPPLEDAIKPARQQLINYYYSDDYKNRLLQAGFSEKEATERIEQLIRNTNSPVFNKQMEDAAGLTFIDITNQNPIKIYLNGSLPDEEFQAAMVEELLHASEMNGVTLKEIIQDPLFWQLSDELKKNLIYMGTYLHNDKAAPYNNLLRPELVKKLNPDLVEYFGKPTEIRARAFGKLLENPKLKFEWDNVYLNSDKKTDYFNKVIGLGVPIAMTQKDKFGGKIKYSYLDFFKR